MRSGDLSTEIALEILAPAPAVRPVAGQSSNQEARAKARRRLRAAEENHAEEISSENGDPPAHQLDDLA